MISNNLAHDGSWASFGRTSWVNVVSLGKLVHGFRCETNENLRDPNQEKLRENFQSDRRAVIRSWRTRPEVSSYKVQRLLAIIFYTLWKSKCNVFA